MAKSAKKCPSCGGKNKNRGKKKLIAFVMPNVGWYYVDK